MTIRVGTLVVRHYPDNGTNPCEDHIDWERHAEADTDGILDVCLGLVIECIASETDITVNWLQRCPYAEREDVPAQESINYNLVYEVGQLR